MTLAEVVYWIKERLGLRDYVGTLPFSDEQITDFVNEAIQNLTTNIEVPECFGLVQETLQAGEYILSPSNYVLWVDEVQYDDPEGSGKVLIKGIPWRLFERRYSLPPGDGYPSTYAERRGVGLVFDAKAPADLALELYAYSIPDDLTYSANQNDSPVWLKQPYLEFVRNTAAARMAENMFEQELAVVLRDTARSAFFSLAAAISRRQKAGHMRRSLYTGGAYGIA